MRNSVEKFHFLLSKTQFSLQLEDSRLQANDAQSDTRLTQWKHNFKTLLEILTFILNTTPPQKSSVELTSNTRRSSLAWKSVVKEAYYYPKA